MAATDKMYGHSRVNKFVLISVLVSVIFLPRALLSQDSDVSGVVRDNAGHPLADIRVFGMYHFPSGGAERRDVKTDINGHFALKNVGQVIFFVAAEYENLTRLRKADESSIEVTLKPKTKSHWPSKCSSNEEAGGKRYGSMFLFFVPDSAKTKHYSGDDTWDLVIKFPHSKTNERLLLWSGPLLGTAFVPEETVLNAKSFTQQEFDWRGKDQNDMNWRWNSSMEDLIHYEKASDEGAQFFDRVIDSACLRNFDR